MIISLADLRTNLRISLQDTAAPFQWPDNVLHLCLWEAITEHSYLFPWRFELSFPVAADQTVFELAPTSPDPTDTNPEGIQILGVIRVELPAGTQIPEDVPQTSDPAGSRARRTGQAWRLRGTEIVLHNPASGAETLGILPLRVEFLRTWIRPGATGNAWNGPPNDLPLVDLLAQRLAYERLRGWRARDGAAVDSVAAAIAALDADIARAVQIRRLRAVRSRTIDI